MTAALKDAPPVALPGTFRPFLFARPQNRPGADEETPGVAMSLTEPPRKPRNLIEFLFGRQG
jgi:hypothetical protein